MSSNNTSVPASYALAQSLLGPDSTSLAKSEQSLEEKPSIVVTASQSKSKANLSLPRICLIFLHSNVKDAGSILSAAIATGLSKKGSVMVNTLPRACSILADTLFKGEGDSQVVAAIEAGSEINLPYGSTLGGLAGLLSGQSKPNVVKRTDFRRVHPKFKQLFPGSKDDFQSNDPPQDRRRAESNLSLHVSNATDVELESLSVGLRQAMVAAIVSQAYTHTNKKYPPRKLDQESVLRLMKSIDASGGGQGEHADAFSEVPTEQQLESGELPEGLQQLGEDVKNAYYNANGLEVKELMREGIAVEVHEGMTYLLSTAPTKLREWLKTDKWTSIEVALSALAEEHRSTIVGVTFKGKDEKKKSIVLVGKKGDPRAKHVVEYVHDQMKRSKGYEDWAGKDDEGDIGLVTAGKSWCGYVFTPNNVRSTQGFLQDKIMDGIDQKK